MTDEYRLLVAFHTRFIYSSCPPFFIFLLVWWWSRKKNVYCAAYAQPIRTTDYGLRYI